MEPSETTEKVMRLVFVSSSCTIDKYGSRKIDGMETISDVDFRVLLFLRMQLAEIKSPFDIWIIQPTFSVVSNRPLIEDVSSYYIML